MSMPHEVERMEYVGCQLGHGPAEVPIEGKWIGIKEVKDISGLSHGIGWCAPHQGCCKLTLNVKYGIIMESLIETTGCTGATHGAAVAGEQLPGKTLLEAINTHLACDAMNMAMKNIFEQFIYGRTQSAFSEGGLPIGASIEDLGKGMRSQVGTVFSTLEKGVRYMEMAEGYILDMALNEDREVIGFRYVHVGKMLDAIRNGVDHKEAYEKNIGTYGQYDDAVDYIDPREK